MSRGRGGKDGGGELAIVPAAQRGDAPDFDGPRAAVEEARKRVNDLGRAVFDQPGNRDEVGGLLRAALGSLCAAEGQLAEAAGVNARVDAQRRAVIGA